MYLVGDIFWKVGAEKTYSAQKGICLDMEMRVFPNMAHISFKVEASAGEMFSRIISIESIWLQAHDIAGIFAFAYAYLQREVFFFKRTEVAVFTQNK